jgi:hypothetical protein
MTNDSRETRLELICTAPIHKESTSIIASIDQMLLFMFKLTYVVPPSATCQK